RSTRRFLRHLAQSYSSKLSQFLPTGKTLAVYRDQARARSTMNRSGAAVGHAPNDNAIMTAHTLPALQPPPAVPPATPGLLSDVIAGLSSDPRALPCKYFYDERGAALF